MFLTTNHWFIPPGGLPYKSDRGDRRNCLEKNPKKVPESRFVGVARINLHP